MGIHMGQLEKMVEYSPAAWLEQGILFVQARASTPSKVVKAVLRKGIGLAAASAIVFTPHVEFRIDSAVSWPPTLESQRDSQVLASLEAIGARIDSKLARFLAQNPSIDQTLLAEARLTLASAKRA
jgi:hypothetical protein